MLEVIIAILILLAIYILITYNRLIKQQLKVKQSKSGIDVYLQQRFDLIPNLVTCVKKYCEYEKELLKEIAELRTVYATNKNLDTGKELNEKISSLLAVAENYPDLKADEQFLNLQKNLLKMENQLQAARRLYNIEVTAINTIINSFPSGLIAKFFGFQTENLFEIDDLNAKLNVKIDM